MIDPQSHIPVYRQIVEHICAAVAAGVYQPGESLPSIRVLALELLVNPNTVQRAYRELERQNLLVTRRGLGAFVSDNGHAIAIRQAEKTLRARLCDAIVTGYAANMTEERLAALFREALEQARRRDPQPQDRHQPANREEQP